MEKVFFDSEASKVVCSFIDKDRSILNAKIGEVKTITVEDNYNNKISILFRTTRNTYLGKVAHWVYGEVLNAADGKCRQIEIKTRIGKPEDDTVEVYLMAPLSNFSKLR